MNGKPILLVCAERKFTGLTPGGMSQSESRNQNQNQGKKVRIDNKSFVGLGSRSKAGCIACRKRKKKCDEVHPVCGLCKLKNTVCVWRNINFQQHKLKFDMQPMMEAQKLIKQQRNTPTNNPVVAASKVTEPTLSGIDETNQVSVGSAYTAPSPLSGGNHQEAKFASSPVYVDHGKVTKPKKCRKVVSTEIIQRKLTNAVDIPSPVIQSPLYNSQIGGLGIIADPDLYTPDINTAVDELMDDDHMLGEFMTNVIEHINSPAFHPETSLLDLSITSAMKQAHDILGANRKSHSIFSHIDTMMDSTTYNVFDNSVAGTPFSPTHFLSLNQDDDSTTNDTISSSNARISELFDDENQEGEEAKEADDDEDLDKYMPMDESQMLENLYVSDSELIQVFKTKRLRPYLKPAVHLLLSKNNSLKVINPSSTIMRALDSTGKLFLENYVTNLAMSQLDIGNNQFFLDYALSVASDDPAILYCLVAWGGMFLVGRNNAEANHYFEKSCKMIEDRRTLGPTSSKMVLSSSGSDGSLISANEIVSIVPNSVSDLNSTVKLSNEENLKILLFYVLLTAAEISTGDVGRWFQMLLQCKEILEDYGGLSQFMNQNKHSKVAKWILSNIFYHDVLCTRTLDNGTCIAIDEYKSVFKNDSFLNIKDYGLDPFYGLSRDLYILLGEVANYRQLMKNMRLPLKNSSYEKDGRLNNAKYQRDTEESWFQIFDLKIQHCKPPSEMVEMLLKDDPEGKLLELHFTWYELTQISLRIYIRINFKENYFDDQEIQNLRASGLRLFNILVGTKLQSLLGLSLLMFGVTSVSSGSREEMKNSYDGLLSYYQIVNVQVCWEVIQQVWERYDTAVEQGGRHYVDWPQIVSSMGWNCCFT